MSSTTRSDKNIFLRLRPLQKMIISLLATAIVFFIAPSSLPKLIIAMLLWNVFALLYLIQAWIIILKRPIVEIRKTAKQDDGSATYVFFLVVVSSFASLVTVLLLIVSHDDALTNNVFYLPVAIGGILLSWIMVHTIYTFHYAHLYYDDDEKKPGKDAFGLEFPGDDTKPNYVDFAYFAFVIGCTFQVSDVEISSPKIRRVALVHGLLSFCLNTFVVALTVNLVAGLSK